MTKSEYGRRFLRSPLGLGSASLAALGGVAAWRLGLGPLPALAAAAGLFFVLGLAALLTGLGPRAAALEAEREAASRGEARRAEAASLRDRLSRLRLGDSELSAARDLLVLEASRLVDRGPPPRAGAGPSAARAREEAAELAGFEPALAQALAEALELIQAWLREADESAVEQRFGAPDAHPFPEAKERVLAALAEKTILLVRLRDRGLAAAPDILALDEELR